MLSQNLKNIIILLLLSASIYGFAQKTELDFFREIHSEQDVRKYIKLCYGNDNVDPFSIAEYDAIRSKQVGETFIDPTFGRPWTLIFERGETIMNSERNTWNSDTSLFFLENGTGGDYRKLALFNGKTTEFIRDIIISDIPKTGSNLPSTRWMPGDPDKLFYIHSNKIYTYSISANTTTVYQEFASFNSTESKIAGGDGNEVATNGDFLIGNKGEDCFVYNFFDKKVVRIQDNERFYYEPTQAFPTFNLGKIDYAIAFAGYVLELDEDGGGTQLRDYNGSSKQKLYKRTPHMDPTYYLHDGILYPGIDVRYNSADADYYTAQGLPSSVNVKYFHAFDPENPTKLIRFTMDLWPSTTLGSGGQVSNNRFNGSTGILNTHGPALYDLTWEARFGECYEKAFRDDESTMPRRIAHHYIGFEKEYPSSSYQPEGWQSPDGTFVIIKTYWGWYKVNLFTDRLTKAEVDNYLNNPSPDTYILDVEKGVGSTECIEGVKRTVIANNAPSGEVFDKWTGEVEYIDDINSMETYVLMPAKNIAISATYKEAPKFNLNIEIDGSGNVLTTPSGDSFYQGTTVALTAKPDDGISFVRWRGGLIGTQNPALVVLDSNITVQAVFSDGSTVSINDFDNFDKVKFEVSSNPVNDNFYFQVQSSVNGCVEISIFDLNGKLIDKPISGKIEDRNKNFFFANNTILQSGVYIAALTIGNVVKILKIIKK